VASLEHALIRPVLARNNPSAADALNVENLPKVLADAEIEVSQADIGSLLSILETYQIGTVGDLESRLTASRRRRMAAVVMKKAPGESLTAFHIVSAVAMLPATATDDQVARHLEVCWIWSRSRGVRAAIATSAHGDLVVRHQPSSVPVLWFRRRS
jgi:hypothetical protein